MLKTSLYKKILLNIHVLIFLIFFLHSCTSGSGPTTGNTPNEMFSAIVSSSLEGVQELQGTGDTWQGYDIYLRFKAEKNFEEKLIQWGYQSMLCKPHYFALPDRRYDIFKKPTWGDLKINDGKCYEKNKVQNTWTHGGTHYFHISPKDQTVHFHGIGS